MKQPHAVTIDLKGLGLSDSEFKQLQVAIHQTTLAEIVKLESFQATGIGFKPALNGPEILGIVIEKLRVS